MAARRACRRSSDSRVARTPCPRLERFLDAAAGHELLAQQPHRHIHALADQRFATARNQLVSAVPRPSSLAVETSRPVMSRPQVAAFTNTEDCAEMGTPVAG